MAVQHSNGKGARGSAKSKEAAYAEAEKWRKANGNPDMVITVRKAGENSKRWIWSVKTQ